MGNNDDNRSAIQNYLHGGADDISTFRGPAVEEVEEISTFQSPEDEKQD